MKFCFSFSFVLCLVFLSFPVDADPQAQPSVPPLVVEKPEPDLRSFFKGADQLEKAIEKYRNLQSKGGWPPISKLSKGQKLEPGAQDPRVVELRLRLAVTGELKKASDSDIFDEELVEALQRFQLQHGLEADGTLGASTLAALNFSVEDAIRKMEINIDRLKRIQDEFGDHYVFVNVPDYRLFVVDKGDPVLMMNVVVGQKREWQTPAVDSEIKFLSLNPKWHVPPTIYKREVLRHIQKDVAYLDRQNMQVIGDEGVVDPATIDWAADDTSRYRIVQRSGGGNALGRIKFMFPNPYDVYLHDTPSKSFFKKPMRALSHGCVRVQNPMDLAAFLIKDKEGWDRSRVEKAIASGREQSVLLDEPYPVHIFYLTAWVDQNGTVQLRDDIYGRDRNQAAELPAKAQP